MNILRKALAALALSGLAAGASAGVYSGVTIFGDSLSDTGNVFLATGGAVPAPPYFNGRFSNGPVWVDHLAAGLGTVATPALIPGGNNFAFGGARTGANPADFVPGLLAQTAGLWVPSLMGGPADPNRLYVLVGGGNDMRDARSEVGGNDATRQAAAAAAAANLVNSLGVLAANGAKHVLVANMPDLGRTPEAVILGLAAESSDASARFNALLPTILGAGQSFGLDMMFLDMAALSDAIFADALNNGGAEFGITNVFTPCGPFPGSIGISCDVSLFSDALHPSARAHAFLGAAALRAVGIAEPQTLAVMALGLFLLAWRTRRRT